jgi:hypothetical protein
VPLDGPREYNEKVNQADEVLYRLQGHNNLVATNGTINGNKVYQGYNDDDIVGLHSCSRLKCTCELMLM